MKKIYNIIALVAALCVFTPFAKAQGVTFEGQWIENNGFGYTKYISQPNTEGVYTITLESFTTGQVTVTHKSIPADIVLVLDCSGSMANTMSGGTANDNSTNQSNWSKKKVLRNAVTNFINAIYENDTVDPETNQPRPTPLGNRISIVFFAAHGASSTKVELANGAVTRGTTPDTYQLNTSITSAVSDIYSSGQTWADEGMQKAYNQVNFNDDTRKRRTVVLFTDGIPGNGTSFTTTNNVGPTNNRRRVLTGGPTYQTSGSYNTWACANNVINIANNIKNLSDEAKDIRATVYTVSVVNNPNAYINVYLGKTSSEWKNATKMGDLEPYTYNNTTYTLFPTWDSSNIWNNGDGTRNDDGNTYAYATTNAQELNNIFESIASSSGGSSAPLDEATVSQVDVVSASFSLPEGADKNSIEVYTVRYTGDNADGTHNFKTKTVGTETVDDLVKAPNSTEKYLKKWKDDQGVEHEEMTDIDDGITWDLTPSQTGSTKKDTVSGLLFMTMAS